MRALLLVLSVLSAPVWAAAKQPTLYQTDVQIVRGLGEVTDATLIPGQITGCEVMYSSESLETQKCQVEGALYVQAGDTELKSVLLDRVSYIRSTQKSSSLEPGSEGPPVTFHQWLYRGTWSAGSVETPFLFVIHFNDNDPSKISGYVDLPDYSSRSFFKAK